MFLFLYISSFVDLIILVVVSFLPFVILIIIHQHPEACHNRKLKNYHHSGWVGHMNRRKENEPFYLLVAVIVMKWTWLTCIQMYVYTFFSSPLYHSNSAVPHVRWDDTILVFQRNSFFIRLIALYIAAWVCLWRQIPMQACLMCLVGAWYDTILVKLTSFVVRQ